MKKHNLVYKTVNLINSKFYIGKHSTDHLNDGYLGSGLLLKAAIRIYGKENFKREILHDLSTSYKAANIERELITEELLLNDQCYNIALGGTGGNLGKEVNKKIGKKMSAILSGVPKTQSHIEALKATWLTKNYKLSSELKNKIKKTVSKTWALMSTEERKKKCGHSGEKNGFFEKSHSIKSLELMKYNLPDRSGSKNSRARQVTFNGVVYLTQKECMEKLNISKRKLSKLLGETQ